MDMHCGVVEGVKNRLYCPAGARAYERWTRVRRRVQRDCEVNLAVADCDGYGWSRLVLEEHGLAFGNVPAVVDTDVVHEHFGCGEKSIRRKIP